MMYLIIVALGETRLYAVVLALNIGLADCENAARRVWRLVVLLHK